MDRKLIFLDIDGTLTPAGSNVPPDSALEAIRRARENGHLIFLCTGWVKNLPDGRVEMEVQGDTANVRRFYLRLKDRPPIRIDRADITVVPLVSGERTFSVSRWESI